MPQLMIGRRPPTESELALMAAAMAAAPVGVYDEAEPLLPKTPGVGLCRLCGLERPLTREHLPPQVLRNREARGAREHTLEEWLGRDEQGVIPGGQEPIDGIWGYALCGPCNHRTGAYAPEYYRWVETATRWLLRDLPIDRDELDHSTTPVGLHIKMGTNPYPDPGAFVRQVLSCFCTLSANWQLAERFPVIRDIVLHGRRGALPQGMKLEMILYFGPFVRISGPQRIVTDGSTWRWVMELAYPPFAFTFTLASNGDVANGLDISSMTSRGPGRLSSPLEFDIPIGFGHLAYPTDFRSIGEIEAESTAV
jgi:hypothetical protein